MSVSYFEFYSIICHAFILWQMQFFFFHIFFVLIAETICFSQLEFWLEKLKSTLYFSTFQVKTQTVQEFKPNNSDWKSRYSIRNLQEFWWRCIKILMFLQKRFQSIVLRVLHLCKISNSRLIRIIWYCSSMVFDRKLAGTRLQKSNCQSHGLGMYDVCIYSKFQILYGQNLNP